MKKYKLGTALLLSIALATTATAQDQRSVVQTQSGDVVVNSFDNCARTQWSEGQDACSPGKRVLAQDDRTIYFGFNQSTLTPQARVKLDGLAAVLKAQTNVQGARIVGYADRVGSTSYNEQLSKKRAEAVRKYIVSRGFVNASVAETRWLGEDAPVTSCPDSLARPKLIECLQKDRRVEVEVDYTEQQQGKAVQRR